MIILLDGKEYAVGLNWFAITSYDEVAQFEREMDLHYGVLKMGKKAGEPSSVALAGPEYGDQVSLAGMLSFAYSNLLFVTRTDVKNEAGQPLYYLCAVKNGIVSVEGDVIADLDTVKSTYQQNLAEMTVDLPLASIERFACGVDEGAFPDLNPVEIGTVLDNAQRYSPASTIKVLEKKALPMTTVIMVVSAFLIGSGLLLGWIFKAPPPPPPPPPPKHEQVVIKKDPFQEFLEKFLPTLQGSPRPSVIEDFVSTVKGMPMSFSGWSVDVIRYEGVHPGILGLQLKRNVYTTVNNLIELHEDPLLKSANIDEDGNSAVGIYVFDATPEYIDQSMIKELKQGASAQYADFVSLMQLHHILYTDTTDKKITFFNANHFSVAGEGLWMLSDLGLLLEKIPTVGISSLTIKVQNGTYMWIIEGMVYG